LRARRAGQLPAGRPDPRLGRGDPEDAPRRRMDDLGPAIARLRRRGQGADPGQQRAAVPHTADRLPAGLAGHRPGLRRRMRNLLLALALLAAPLPALAQTSAADAGAAFLAKNKTAPGVVTLPDGLQYKVLANGPAGGGSPTVQNLIAVDYEG